MRPLLSTVILVLAMVLSACADPAQGRYGADLYGVTCARCHGANLQGGIGPAIGPGSNAAAGLSDEQIRGVIEIGPGAMPSFRRLDDDQIDSLVAYLRERQGR